MEDFIFMMLLSMFLIGRFLTKHPNTSGTVAKGLLQWIFRK